MRLYQSPFPYSVYFDADEGAGSGGSGTSDDKTLSAKAGAGDKAPEHVTKAEFETLRADFQKRLDDQSGMLGGINNNIQKLLKPAEKKPDAEKDPTLTQRVDAIEARDKLSRENLKSSTLQSAAMRAGVPETRAERFAKMILAEYGEKIDVTKDNKVTFKESEDKTVSISEWISAYLKSADGEFFLPPKQTGVSDGQSGGGGNGAGPHPFVAMTFEQIMQQRPLNPDAFMTYVEKHPEDWDKKQKTLSLARFRK